MARALIIPRQGPAAAPAAFPYNHRTLAQTDTSDPVHWREANAAHFDAVYGPEVRHYHRDGTPSCRMYGRAERLAAARQWRIETRPFFDAIHGPEPVCPCGAA